MSLFIDPNRTKRFIVEEERGLDPSLQHVFILKTLKSREYTERYDRCRDHMDGDLVARLNLGSWQRWTLYYGLVGAEGAFPVPFSLDPNTGHVSETFLDSLHPNVRRDLAMEIDRLSKLAHDDPKG